MKTKKINSSFELMRIVSILLIILFHVLYHGNIIETCNNIYIKQILTYLLFFSLIHVNSFIILTGYYQNKKEIRLSKVFNIIGQVIFYMFLIYILLLVFNIITFNKLEFILNFLPLELIFNSYWFVKYYLILYFLSPYINKLIDHITKKEYINLLIILTLTMSILPILTNLQGFDNNGFTLYHFIYLYLIGAYINRYPIKINKLSTNKFRIILISIILLSALINTCIFNIGEILSTKTDLIQVLGITMKNTSGYYNNPLIIIETISYFLLFETLTINNKIINKIGSLSFGIYLIHDNYILREYLYKFINISNINTPIYYLIYVIGVVLEIYIVCSIIEFIRQLLFNGISKLYKSKNNLKTSA